MSVLSVNTAEVARAEEQYLENDALIDSDVQDDEDARVTAFEATDRDDVDNDELATDLNTVNATVAGGVMPVYAGGNVVNDENPLVMDTLVRDALDAGDIFHTGGQIPPNDFSEANVSDYLDMTWLVEAAKKTGEKPF